MDEKNNYFVIKMKNGVVSLEAANQSLRSARFYANKAMDKCAEYIVCEGIESYVPKNRVELDGKN